MADNYYPHIILKTLPEISDFTSYRQGRSTENIPQRNRQKQSQRLLAKLEEAWQEATEEQEAVVHADKKGIYLEFRSDPGYDLITKSLEDLNSKKVRLLNVRKVGEEEPITYATVFVAHEKKDYFLKKIEKYKNEESPSGEPKNARLINSINDVQKAVIESFWTDEKTLLPEEERDWCEVWLSSDKKEIRIRFEEILKNENIDFSKGFLVFPERTVKQIKVNKDDIDRLIKKTDHIAEFRKAKENACFWLNMKNWEQVEWIQDLLNRRKISEKADDFSVCIIDTGINYGHPLLKGIIGENDCFTVDPSWGTNDHDSHGTLMAGIAAYGDLEKCLEQSSPVVIEHKLESVKLLPPKPPGNPEELWGYLTSQAVSRAEIKNPARKRVNCLAVSAKDGRDRGRPSSWSGEIDKIAFGGEDESKLIVVSAGNCLDESPYPLSQLKSSIPDPGQTWNALTVGAYTELDRIEDPDYSGYQPVAPKGGLSPYSSTSLDWDDLKWPNKPDIVLEGGNQAVDDEGFVTDCEDLSLLSIHHQPLESHFAPHNMTSAATAKASWMAAKIKNRYPGLWAETVRGLIVHSAEWSEEMERQFIEKENKQNYSKLLRICGYGVPDLNKAIFSLSNSLTLLTQNWIQPFKKGDSGSIQTNEMHLFELPWPKEELQKLPLDTEVKMEVTLSYFVEPGPGEIGWDYRYRYPSFGLRFEVINPEEDKTTFIKRINKAAKDEEEKKPQIKSSLNWKIGDARNKGSIHSDVWVGSANALAESNIIAIYPISGWWKERRHLRKWQNKGKYSLIISISTKEKDVDIYTPVAIKAGIQTPTPVEIET